MGGRARGRPKVEGSLLRLAKIALSPGGLGSLASRVSDGQRPPRAPEKAQKRGAPKRKGGNFGGNSHIGA